MSDDGLAALGELRLDIDHGDVMASVQENFRNACAHIACAEYTYFHVIKPLSYSLIGSLIVISRKSMQKGSGEAPPHADVHRGNYLFLNSLAGLSRFLSRK